MTDSLLIPPFPWGPSSAGCEVSSLLPMYQPATERSSACASSPGDNERIHASSLNRARHKRPARFVRL
jgi:hypothetical protein